MPITIVQNEVNKGKGYSIRKGIKVSDAKYIIYTDVDFPYTTQSLVNLYYALEGDRDVVLGVRDQLYYDEIPSSRKRISKLLKSVNQKLLKLATPDTQCGLKGMNQKGKSLLLQTTQDRYLIDLEFIKLLTKRREIKVSLETVKLREGVTFSKVPRSKILSEALSYISVLFAR